MKNSTIVIFLLLSTFAFSQNDKYWQEISPGNLPKSNIIEYSAEVEDAKYFSLNKPAIQTILENAPDRLISSSSSQILKIPSPDGDLDSFEMFSTQTMANGLAQNYQQIKSYVGRNLNNKSHRVRITITPYGFYAMTTGSEDGDTFINPYNKSSNLYTVFSKSQASYNAVENFVCETLDFEESSHDNIEADYTTNFIEEGILRKYRLAVATTVEYSDYHLDQAGFTAGDTSPAGRSAVQAAIVVSIDRVNEVFERDFGVTLELISGNDQLISMGDANADPYVNDVSSTLLNQNQTEIDNVIGFTNYDVGHVLCTDGGGLAQTPAVCTSGKARGTTGLSAPVGEYFNISILSHELGHQFGANHTQSSNVNENFATAMEPGSGSTIMGYAGVAPPNIQGQSDAMFHYISISEVSSRFITTTGACAEEIAISNSAPAVQAIPDYTIPKSTPFKLEANATDVNGDVLTYSWDQIDNDVVPNVPMPPAPTSTTGPSFRTFLPTTSPERFFPGMPTLLSNSYSNTWEVLPSVSRDLNFGVIVRDNNSLGGQVAHETTTISVDGTAGPFRVTSQGGGGTTVNWNVNDTETITWDVANTDSFTGINAQNVDIILSADNGQNFDIVLVNDTPNDGSYELTVPNIVTSNARLMIKASDNVFFDINESNISIQASGLTCVAPTNPEVTGVTNNSALLSWNASSSNPADGYDYLLVTDGTVPDSSTTPSGSVVAGVTSENLTSLNSNAFYEVYVRAKCGPGDLSVWSSATEFRTTCAVLTAPVSENFDGADFQIGSTSSNYGSCWNRTPVDSATDYAWVVGSGSTPTANTGPSDDNTGSGKYMYTESDNGLTNDVAVLNSPPIDLSSLTNPILKLNYHMFGSETGTFKVEIKTIGSSIYTTEFMVTGQQQSASADSYLQAIVDLKPYAGETVNVRFIGERGSGTTSDIAIDDFVVEENTCLAPANISLSGITSLEATLAWDAQPNASDGFEWIVMPDSVQPDVANAISTGSAAALSTQTQITGLSAQTNYDVYLRSLCGGGLFSAWSPGISFTTPCDTITAPYTENFDGSNWTSGNPGVIDNCWSRSTLTPGSDYIWIVGDGSTVSSDTGPDDDVSGGGKYLFTEASAFNPPFMNQFDETVLEAPPIDLSGLSVPELKISYHMHGFSMGSLRIEAKNISSSTYTELFSISGEQQTASSDAYIEQSIGLSSFAGQIINVRIVGERGSNFGSDLAIDNFTIEEATDCTTPTGLEATNVTLSSADLNWDSVPNDDNGYEWVVMPSGSSPNPTSAIATGTVNQGITSVQVNGLVSDTNYDAYVRANCGAIGISNWSLVSSFFTGYCDAGPTNSVDSEIENVTLIGENNSITNNTTDICTGGPGGEISDFTNLSADLIAGSNYTLSVEFGDCDNEPEYDGAGGVWIDWNLDGDFEDANEEIGTTNLAVSSGNVLVDYTVAVPLGQNAGNYRMRIVQEEDATSAEVNPCGTFNWGAVEDYTINVIPGATCTVFEDFEAGLPTGWSTVVNTGPCDWSNQSATPGPFDDFPTLAMVFDDDACGSSAPASNVSLLSDVYDTSGASPILISYDVAFQEVNNSGETLTVEVWDGAAWQQIAFYDTNLIPNIQTEAGIDASAYSNADFQVRWTYDDGGAWGWYAGVDNFCMSLTFNNWEGTVNTDWNTADNWSSGTVPTVSDSAVILDVPNQPVIDATTTAEVNALVLNNNTELSVEGILKVSDQVTNDGDIVFRSSLLSGSGQFDEFTGTFTGTGEVTVERYIPARRAYRLLSSPVTTTDFIFENWQESGSNPAAPNGFGTQITGGAVADGFDQNGSGNPSMFTFDNATQNWQPLSNTNNTRLNAEVPYLTMVRGDRTIDLNDNDYPANPTTLRSTGQLFTGPSSPTLSTGLGDFNLIANPYQAVVDYTLATRTDLTDHIYVWDATIGGTNGRGGYVTVDVSSSAVPPPSGVNATKFIAPGMSFFVQNLSTGTISPSLTFDETNKATGENQVEVFSGSLQFYINSRLYLSSDYQNGSSERDAVGLRFSENYTTLGSDEDATKLGNPDENYAVVNNGLRSIDKQALPNLDHEIDLSITNYTGTNYSLTFQMANKPTGLGVFLADKYLNTQTELTESFVYEFSIDSGIPESSAENRFSLVFDNTTLGVEGNDFGENFSLYPNPTNGQFSIKTPGLDAEVDVEIINLVGQQIFKERIAVESQQLNINAKRLSAGVYIVKLHHGDKTFASKLIVQ